MECEIAWNELSLREWEQRFSLIPRSNLLQSYGYARAVCPQKHLRARWGLIRFDGAEAGLVQVLEAGIFKNALHAVILDRGPLWFPGFGSAAHIEAFFKIFAREFPRRFGRRRRIIPETPASPETEAALAAAGLHRLDRPGYQTIWLDMAPDRETLWQNMKSPWRNAVRKGEKSALMSAWSGDEKEILAMLRVYQSDKAKKGYDGPSARFLSTLAKAFVTDESVLVGTATKDGRAVAAALIFCHGGAATWQAGWSTEEGKRVAAQNFLLWQAVKVLKEKGIKFFDLGGANDQSAQGVKTFKEGMGGDTVTLAGHYI